MKSKNSKRFAMCTRCMRIVNKKCLVYKHRKVKITGKGYCKNGWYVECYDYKIFCKIENKYLLYPVDEVLLLLDHF